MPLFAAGCCLHPSKEKAAKVFVRSISNVTDPSLEETFELVSKQAKLKKDTASIGGHVKAQWDCKDREIILAGFTPMENAEPSDFVLDLQWFPFSAIIKKDVPMALLGPPTCTTRYNPSRKLRWIVNRGLLTETVNTVNWYSPAAVGDPLFFCESDSLPALPNLSEARSRVPSSFVERGLGEYCQTTPQSDLCIRLFPKTVLTSEYLQGLSIQVSHHEPVAVSTDDLEALLSFFFPQQVASSLITQLLSAPIQPIKDSSEESVLVSGNLVLIRSREISEPDKSELVWVWRRSDLPPDVSLKFGLAIMGDASKTSTPLK
jgi:hypothetical protein